METNSINSNFKSGNYLITAFLILVLTWSLTFLTKGKSQNTPNSKSNVVYIYGSQSNTPTNDYRFKETRFTPLLKQHKYRLIHDISNHWVNTNIKLSPDKTYYFKVNGLASTSSRKLSLWIGPEGKEYKFEGLPMYSVIGRIGNEEPFLIGSQTEVKPTENELFYLGYNDDMFGDNIGYYIVDIFEGTKIEIERLLNEKNIEVGKYYYE